MRTEQEIRAEKTALKAEMDKQLNAIDTAKVPLSELKKRFSKPEEIWIERDRIIAEFRLKMKPLNDELKAIGAI